MRGRQKYYHFPSTFTGSNGQFSGDLYVREMCYDTLLHNAQN
jgi:hypothetical protein